jgi:hypothetical protein
LTRDAREARQLLDGENVKKLWHFVNNRATLVHRVRRGAAFPAATTQRSRFSPFPFP